MSDDIGKRITDFHLTVSEVLGGMSTDLIQQEKSIRLLQVQVEQLSVQVQEIAHVVTKLYQELHSLKAAKSDAQNN